MGKYLEYIGHRFSKLLIIKIFYKVYSGGVTTGTSNYCNLAYAKLSSFLGTFSHQTHTCLLQPIECTLFALLYAF
jgi:hypothetical protein